MRRFQVVLAAVSLGILCVEPPGLSATPPGGLSADTAAGAESLRRSLWDSPLGMPQKGVTTGIMSDLDGDGLPEIIVTRSPRNGPGELAAFDGERGAELWRARFDGWVLVALADLLGDPAPEIVAACGENLLILDARTGTHRRSARLRAPVGALAAGLFAPGAPALVYTAGINRNDTLVALRGSDLAEIWTRGADSREGRFADGFSKLVVRDVSGDTMDEVLVAENMNELKCLAGDGSVLWSTVLGEMSGILPTGGASCDPVVHDLVPGNGNEVAIGCFGGALLVLDGETGEPLTSARFGVESHQGALSRRGIPRFVRDAIATSGEPIMDMLVGDVDGRPGSELVFGCADGFVYAANPRTGARLWRYDAPGDVTDRPLAVDVNGDGADDAVAWDQEGIHLVDGRTGTAIRGFPAVDDVALVLGGDVNGDARLEIVAVTYKNARIEAWPTDILCARGAVLGTSE